MKADLDQPLTLSQSEMAAVFEVLYGEAAVGDAGFDLAAARDRLLERELLLMPPGRQEPVLNPSLAPILGTATEPQVLAVLEFGGSQSDRQTMYFSWTPERIVWNQVTTDDEHRLESLGSVEDIARVAVDQSDAKRFARAKRTAAGDSEEVVQAAKRRSVLLVVTGVLADEQQVEALSWVESGDRLWLIAGEADSEEPELQPISAAMLRTAITEALERAIRRTAPPNLN